MDDVELLENSKPVQLPRPWGPWATIGWSLVCILVIGVAQFAGLLIFVVFQFATNRSVTVETLATNGNALVLATLLSTPATLGLIAFLVKVRGYPARDYLALFQPTWRSVLIASGGMVILLVAIDLTSYLLGRPLVPVVMVDVYRTAWLPALLLAFIVLAPLAEETLFRGFLYQGIAATRAGPIVAIIVSTLAFALIHIQYDWYGVLGVAAIGLYLGVVRFRAGSLLLTMLIHAVGNLLATLELIVQHDWLK
jgi:membrane protease YdiL (CAAX protease family)